MNKYIIGIDEVGRGPLAGPVVVAAVAIRKEFRSQKLESRMELPKLRDSKKLTALQRGAWERHIKNHPDIHVAYARVLPKTIDRINISRAANLAAKRAFYRLVDTRGLRKKIYSLYLDGGLYLGNTQGTRRSEQNTNCNKIRVRTLVRGDQKINAIKLASIAAKQHRDRYMVRLGRRYPAYGFERHKGYGTKMHNQAIKICGPSPVHRLSFLKWYGNAKSRLRGVIVI